MTTLRIFAFSCALLLHINALFAHSPSPTPALCTDSVRPERVRGVQYASPEEAAAALAAQKQPLWAGGSVSVNLAGALLAACSPYGEYEAAARLNLRGRFFPTLEAGLGVSDHTNETTDIHYKVSAPFFRLGLDYNVAKHVNDAGRIFVGLRYGFSSFKYDLTAPDLADPFYGTSQPFRYSGLKSTNHWAEALFGLEARLWGMVRLGWSLRYRVRLSDKPSAVGSAWYVPGYGKNDTHAMGATFQLIFDI